MPKWTQNDRDKIGAALTAAGVELLCKECASKRAFIIGPVVINVAENLPNESVMGEYMTTAALQCSRCGSLTFHRLKALGLDGLGVDDNQQGTT